MVALPEVIERRREYSERRIEELRAAIAAIDEVAQRPPLAIYATGSYGRLEASERSDLDVFFVHGDVEPPMSRIRKTLIDADLIRLSRRLEFPEFSGDGKYLTVHSVGKMKSALGTPRDDFENLFTARILLLLESVPLAGDELYDSVIRDIVATYYRDFAEHADDFRPLFLINDIIRFWRTVCLNYESTRHGTLDDAAKQKARVRNLKLKFSRSFTCFSAVLLLVKNGHVVTPDEVAELVELPPSDRVIEAARDVERGDELAEEILAEYSWFLSATARDEHELRQWIRDEANHKEALEHARAFGRSLYNLLEAVASREDAMRYLVI
ncbi:MAG: hypothetical protein M3321_11300 [Actinomycetota bacterium]|nr:hypothetical protein [Actinomycetota bacterium]